MSDEFHKLLRVEYGGFSFPAETVTLRDRPTRNEAGSLVSYERIVTCKGRVWGTDAANVVEKTRNVFLATFNGPQALRVIALDSTLAVWLDPTTIAAEGGSGPFVGEVVFGDVTPAYCDYEIPFVATWRFPGGATIPPQQLAHAEQEVIEGNTEAGRTVLTRSGRLQGSAAMAAFATKLPAQSNQQQVRYQTQRNEQDTEVRYRIEITPVYASLPVGTEAGDAVVETVYDGLSKQTSVSGHYVGAAAFEAALSAQSLGPAGTQPIRQRIARNIHASRRVDFAHEFIERLDLPAVLWSERVQFSRRGARVIAKEYPGSTPLLVYQPGGPFVVEHSGQIVTLNSYGPAPVGIFDGEPEAERDVDFEYVDSQRRRTAWRYVYLFADEPQQLRPEGPR